MTIEKLEYSQTLPRSEVTGLSKKPRRVASNGLELLVSTAGDKLVRHVTVLGGIQNGTRDLANVKCQFVPRYNYIPHHIQVKLPLPKEFADDDVVAAMVEVSVQMSVVLYLPALGWDLKQGKRL